MQYLNYHNPNSFINHIFIVPFGQAEPFGRCALISITRLRQE